MEEQEYIEKRIDDQITWYEGKSQTNKILNHWSKGLIIFFSATIPLIAGIEFDSVEKNIILGSLGSLIGIISGLSALFKFQEKWTEYRI